MRPISEVTRRVLLIVMALILILSLCLVTLTEWPVARATEPLVQIRAAEAPPHATATQAPQRTAVPRPSMTVQTVIPTELVQPTPAQVVPTDSPTEEATRPSPISVEPSPLPPEPPTEPSTELPTMELPTTELPIPTETPPWNPWLLPTQPATVEPTSSPGLPTATATLSPTNTLVPTETPTQASATATLTPMDTPTQASATAVLVPTETPTQTGALVTSTQETLLHPGFYLLASKLDTSRVQLPQAQPITRTLTTTTYTLPTPPERRQAEVEYPLQLPLGNSDVIQLTLRVLPSGGPQRSTAVAITTQQPNHGIQTKVIAVPLQYDAYDIIAHVQLVVPATSLQIEPPDSPDQDVPVERGADAVVRWEVSPLQVGSEKAIIKVQFRYTPKQTNSAPLTPQPIDLEPFTISIVTVFGLTAPTAKAVGYISSFFSIATLIGLLDLFDRLRKLWPRPVKTPVKRQHPVKTPTKGRPRAR